MWIISVNVNVNYLGLVSMWSQWRSYAS